jgi:hypothetical protein
MEITDKACFAELLGLANVAQAFEYHGTKIDAIDDKLIQRSHLRARREATFPCLVATELHSKNIKRWVLFPVADAI